MTDQELCNFCEDLKSAVGRAAFSTIDKECSRLIAKLKTHVPKDIRPANLADLIGDGEIYWEDGEEVSA